MTPEQNKSLEVSRTTTFTEFAKEKGTMVVSNTGRGILERLARTEPGNAALQRDLSSSWSKTALALIGSGAAAEGLSALKRGQAMMAQLTRSAPDNLEYKRSLDWYNEQISVASKVP